MPVTILSANVLAPRWEKAGDLPWARRFPLLVAIIKRENPAVLLLQECFAPQTAQIEDALAGGWRSTQAGPNAILWDATRTGSPSVLASHQLIGADDRTVVGVRWDDWSACTTHLTVGSAMSAQRNKQAKEVAAWLPAGPLVVGLDSNSQRSSSEAGSPRHSLAAVGLKMHPAKRKGLDELAVRGLTVTDARLIDPGAASDHPWLICTVTGVTTPPVTSTPGPKEDAVASIPVSHNGWPTITSGLWPLAEVTGSVKAGSVWVTMHWLAKRYKALIEPIDRSQSWGYSYRKVRGSSETWSNHASGTAVDFNSGKHPMGKRGTMSTTQAAACRQIEQESDGVLNWGDNIPDEMHWEVGKGVSPERVERFATRLLQAALNRAAGAGLTVNGMRGADTLSALKHWQAAAGLVADALDGPKTWAALEAAPDAPSGPPAPDPAPEPTPEPEPAPLPEPLPEVDATAVEAALADAIASLGALRDATLAAIDEHAGALAALKAQIKGAQS